MKCCICEQTLPDDALFCHKCCNQIACKECGKPLAAGGLICNYCGLSVTPKTSSPNNFEFKEDKNSRSFTANFSDNTAGSVVETLSHLLANRNYPVNPQLQEYTEVTNAPEKETLAAPKVINTDTSEPDELKLLNEIFQFRGDEIYLHETELKATSLINHIQRVVLLYLYRKYLLGEKTINRSELTDFLNVYEYNTGSYRSWIVSTDCINNTNNQLSLCRAGIDEAKQFLSDVFDSTKSGSWKKTSTKKKANGTNPPPKEAKSKGQSKTYKILGELNFKPKSRESLSDFMSKYTPKNGQVYNLLFVYYLEKILQEPNITPDHVYSCYKSLQIKFPSNLYQSIIDTSRRKGWLNTSNVNDIKVTTNGENVVEHDLLNK